MSNEDQLGNPASPEAPGTGGAPPAPPGRTEDESTLFCPKCGQLNPENNFRCARCGFELHGPAPAIVTNDNTLGGLIPYKNSSALWAYYLGVFSLIPFLGIPLGIAGVILGRKGLKYAREHPEARGKGHAWTGIIAGGFFAFVYTSLIAIPFILMLFNP